MDTGMGISPVDVDIADRVPNAYEATWDPKPHPQSTASAHCLRTISDRQTNATMIDNDRQSATNKPGMMKNLMAIDAQLIRWFLVFAVSTGKHEGGHWLILILVFVASSLNRRLLPRVEHVGTFWTETDRGLIGRHFYFYFGFGFCREESREEEKFLRKEIFVL